MRAAINIVYLFMALFVFCTGVVDAGVLISHSSAYTYAAAVVLAMAVIFGATAMTVMLCRIATRK